MSEPRAKTCGSCTLCCKVLAVEALGKPVGTWCQHRTARGCGIYEDRPAACRSFECIWLMDPEMPHRFRPDQTKVVLDQDAEARWLVARCDPANPQAWRRGAIYQALKTYARSTWGTGRIVLAVAGRQTWLVAPEVEIDLGDVPPEAGIRVVERPDGSIGVEVTPPSA
ncbi:MAG: zinc/iron-chelating domain-containing protein [Phenylobacterium zucineum]|nr:MAG: zinc/iron-chelating domain-containing protein [Phenylobacterium zucineum]